jgi:hypothetical protein
MDGGSILEIERPRSALGLIGATFALYRLFPWLFLVLAAVVVVPYQALLAIPTLGIVHGAAKGWIDFALTIGDIALAVPLISALHVFAVDDVRQGRRPAIPSVARRGIAKLPIVSPAVFLTWIGITLGFVALIVPGVILLLRWAVVAQTGSLEAESWQKALGRSKSLTDDRYWHVLALLLLVLVITAIPTGILIPVYGLRSTSLAPFLIRAALAVATNSFTALATAFLYFDLTARADAAQVGPEPVIVTVSGREVPPSGHPLDPASWSDEDRPRGWYVDPESPWKMRYWNADGTGVWSKRKSKTPKATLTEWRDLRWVRKNEEGPKEPA